MKKISKSIKTIPVEDSLGHKVRYWVLQHLEFIAGFSSEISLSHTTHFLCLAATTQEVCTDQADLSLTKLLTVQKAHYTKQSLYDLKSNFQSPRLGKFS